MDLTKVYVCKKQWCGMVVSERRRRRHNKKYH